jgi:poly-beta-1,6-N-acetyl-D-glucosamine synthase
MIILSIIFIVFFLLLIFSYKKLSAFKIHPPIILPTSIIVAARNEATNVERLIDSVKKINYPKENFELIIVDDNSTDNTYSAAQKLISDKHNFRIIKSGEKSLPGKRGALQKGIEASKFPYILITDADCVVSPGWLKIYASVFQQGYDFIFGAAPFYQQKNFINKSACFENLKNQFLSFSLADLGIPYTASARNLGFTKEAFYKIGGYRNTTDTLSGDDDLLLRQAVKNNLRIKSVNDKNSFVYSDTKTTLKEYLAQRTRHTQSSLHYNFKAKLVLGSWHLLNLFMFLSPLLMFFSYNFIWLFVLKMVIDTMIFYFVQNAFGYRFNIFQIFFFDMTYEIFIAVNFFNALFRKAEWK